MLHHLYISYKRKCTVYFIQIQFQLHNVSNIQLREAISSPRKIIDKIFKSEATYSKEKCHGMAFSADKLVWQYKLHSAFLSLHKRDTCSIQTLESKGKIRRFHQNKYVQLNWRKTSKIMFLMVKQKGHSQAGLVSKLLKQIAKACKAERGYR